MFILKALNLIKGFDFLDNPPDVCAPARSTPRHLHRRQSHHRASPVSLFLINNFITSHRYFIVILNVLRIIVVRILVTYCLSIISILHQKGSEALSIPLRCLHFHNHKTWIRISRMFGIFYEIFWIVSACWNNFGTLFPDLYTSEPLVYEL